MYKYCPLVIHDREFSVDLIALPFHEFDLILGMDWLSKHQAIVNCDKKTVVLKCSDLSEVNCTWYSIWTSVECNFSYASPMFS